MPLLRERVLWGGMSHFHKQTAAPVLLLPSVKLVCELIKIPGLTSFPEMPVKPQAAIHPKYQYYSPLCVYNLFTSIPTSVCAC